MTELMDEGVSIISPTAVSPHPPLSSFRCTTFRHTLLLSINRHHEHDDRVMVVTMIRAANSVFIVYF